MKISITESKDTATRETESMNTPTVEQEREKARNLLDLTNPENLLRYLLAKNGHGAWFIRIDERYTRLPGWMRAYCEKACPEPSTVLGKEE